MAQKATKNFVGLKVITVFTYRGAKIYIRSRDHFFEQLIIYKGELFTHYFEIPTEPRHRPLFQEEEMNAMQTIMDLAKETVDNIKYERSLRINIRHKLKNYINGIFSKAADVRPEPEDEVSEPEQAETSRPSIEVPKQERRHKGKRK